MGDVLFNRNPGPEEGTSQRPDPEGKTSQCVSTTLHITDFPDFDDRLRFLFRAPTTLPNQTHQASIEQSQGTHDVPGSGSSKSLDMDAEMGDYIWQTPIMSSDLPGASRLSEKPSVSPFETDHLFSSPTPAEILVDGQPMDAPLTFAQGKLTPVEERSPAGLPEDDTTAEVTADSRRGQSLERGYSITLIPIHKLKCTTQLIF